MARAERLERRRETTAQPRSPRLRQRLRIDSGQPRAQARDRRQRAVPLERGYFSAELLRNTLDQKIPERYAAQPGLAVADRIENSDPRLERSLTRRRIADQLL